MTHSSHFHPDDVCAVAVLHMVLGGKYRLVRTRNMDIAGKADFLVDFGGEHDPLRKRFDHHQAGGAGKRENGAPYASFGLVWKEYGERLCGSKSLVESIDKDIVAPLDASDNGIDFPPDKDGVTAFLFGDFLHSFNPAFGEDENSRDERFMVALQYAVIMISRAIERGQKNEKGREVTKAIYQSTKDKRIIVLEKEYPWRKVLSNHPEPLIVVYPNSQDKTWSAKVVPVADNRFENRIFLPEAWAGKRDSDMAKVSGVSDAIFCHNARFMAVARSKEGAIELAKKAIGA